MNADEVQTIIHPVLNSQGIEFRDVIPQLHEDSKRPVIKWHNNGKDIYVSPEFRVLTPAEMKFGALWTLLPKPIVKNRVADAMQLGFALLFEVFLLLILFDAGTPSIFSIVVATLILLSFGQFIRSRHKDRQVAAHLDHIVAITEDPISARTFLEKAFGPLRPNSIWKTDLSIAEHPMMKYKRQGRDERLKAILMSDLAHPVGAVEGSRPD